MSETSRGDSLLRRRRRLGAQPVAQLLRLGDDRRRRRLGRRRRRGRGLRLGLLLFGARRRLELVGGERPEARRDDRRRVVRLEVRRDVRPDLGARVAAADDVKVAVVVGGLFF